MSETENENQSAPSPANESQQDSGAMDLREDTDAESPFPKPTMETRAFSEDFAGEDDD